MDIDELKILIEKYKDIAEGLSEKYEKYKKLQEEGNTPLSILEIMYNEIEATDKELSNIRTQIANLKNQL